MIELDENETPIVVTDQVLKFRDFLISCWGNLDKLMENHDWEDDGKFTREWIQANWEFLVERELLGGKACLSTLEWCDRITQGKSHKLYGVVCKVPTDYKLRDLLKETLNYENEDLLLFGFRTQTESIFGVYPPFDYAEIRTSNKKKIYVVPLDLCQFHLKILS